MAAAKLIDGRAVARDIQACLAGKLTALRDKVVPTLATVLVGNRTDSKTYLRHKRIAAESIGIRVRHIELPEDSSEGKLLGVIDGLNYDPLVHGLLVQFPLPPHISVFSVIKHISPVKDVDGVHPLNVGLLSVKGAEPYHVPCTPLAILTLLDRYQVPIAGRNITVVGRSQIVGQPVSQLLNRRDATVTLCHSKTENLRDLVRQADVVVAAAGSPHLIRGDWIKPGAAVIDVGINPISDCSKRQGYRLVGDVCFHEACNVAGLLSPVPGGVGPVTIAMLLSNTTRAAMCQSSLVMCDPLHTNALTERVSLASFQHRGPSSIA